VQKANLSLIEKAENTHTDGTFERRDTADGKHTYTDTHTNCIYVEILHRCVF